MLPTIQEPVTGREQVADPAQPLAALAQFYRALNTRDIATLEENWDAAQEIAMDNPLGGIKRGWAEIREVYDSLFHGAKQFRFEFYDYTLHRYGDVFIAVGRERGEFESLRGLRLNLAIRTTRIFRWVNDRWRQIHHHGSIDDPELLTRYQRAVMKRAA